MLKNKHVAEREIVELLGIDSADISHLMNGEFQRFSKEELLMLLDRLKADISDACAIAM
jgi:predicted XRE-type DNA-binding protein